jgi:hypothetical protein
MVRVGSPSTPVYTSIKYQPILYSLVGVSVDPPPPPLCRNDGVYAWLLIIDWSFH